MHINIHMYTERIGRKVNNEKTDQIQTFLAKTDANRKSYAEFGSSENHSPKSVCVCVYLCTPSGKTTKKTERFVNVCVRQYV